MKSRASPLPLPRLKLWVGQRQRRTFHGDKLCNRANAGCGRGSPWKLCRRKGFRSTERNNHRRRQKRRKRGRTQTKKRKLTQAHAQTKTNTQGEMEWHRETETGTETEQNSFTWLGHLGWLRRCAIGAAPLALHCPPRAPGIEPAVGGSGRPPFPLDSTGPGDTEGLRHGAIAKGGERRGGQATQKKGRGAQRQRQGEGKTE